MNKNKKNSKKKVNFLKFFCPNKIKRSLIKFNDLDLTFEKVEHSKISQ